MEFFFRFIFSISVWLEVGISKLYIILKVVDLFVLFGFSKLKIFLCLMVKLMWLVVVKLLNFLVSFFVLIIVLLGVFFIVCNIVFSGDFEVLVLFSKLINVFLKCGVVLLMLIFGILLVWWILFGVVFFLRIRCIDFFWIMLLLICGSFKVCCNSLWLFLCGLVIRKLCLVMVCVRVFGFFWYSNLFLFISNMLWYCLVLLRYEVF